MEAAITVMELVPSQLSSSEAPSSAWSDDEVIEVECFGDDEDEASQDEVEVDVDLDDEVEVDVDRGDAMSHEGMCEPAIMSRTAVATASRADRTAKSRAIKEANDSSETTWVCCDACLKWRRMPHNEVPADGHEWVCAMSGDPIGCAKPQEELMEDESEDEQYKLPEGLAAQWVQCDECTKWRSLPQGSLLPDGRWVCAMNPRGSHNRCEVEEEELGEDELEEEDAAVVEAEEAADAALKLVETSQKSALDLKRDLVEARSAAAKATAAMVAAREAVAAAKVASNDAEAEASEEAEAAAAATAAEAAAEAAAAAAAAEERAAAAAAWIEARNRAMALAASAAADVAEASGDAASCADVSSGAHGRLSPEGSAEVDAAPALSQEAAAELLERANTARRGGNASSVIHGWSISYVLRPPGSSSRGDSAPRKCPCHMGRGEHVHVGRGEHAHVGRGEHAHMGRGEYVHVGRGVRGCMCPCAR